MDKKLTIGILLAVLIIGFGAVLLFKKPQTTLPITPSPDASAPTTTQQPAPATVARTIVVPLSSQNNSGESGTATLTDVGGRTNVVLALSGAPASITQPAHIHTGTCAAIGGVTYPLTFPINGKSETTLNVSIDELLKQLPLAINIHKSNAEANIFVACGDITGQGAAAVDDNRSNAGTFSTPTDNRRGADKPEN